MPIPFPKNIGKSAPGRKLSRVPGRLPIPANDRPVFRLPTARQALPSGALSPTPFQGPAISYGRPAPSAKAPLYVPKGINPSAAGRFASGALRVLPYAFFVNEAVDMLPDSFLTRTPGGRDNIPLAPHNGWWIRLNGPHTAQSGTYPVRADNIYQSLTNYHEYIGGQAIST